MARLIEHVIGHQEQINRLNFAQVNGSLPHAMVFSGPQGVGKMSVALALAQNLTCENFTDKACGVCGACRRAEKQQSENVKIVSPQGAYIKIEQIRDVLDYLSLASEGHRRVIIIDQAQTLNPQASNALLKTLEEPADNVFFILITADVRLLMPTIRSRSQVVLFKSLSIEELQRIKPDLPIWVYKAARGQASRLTELTDSDTVEKRIHDLQFYERFWTDEDFIHQFDVKDFAKDRAEASKVIKNWSVFTRDLILCLHEDKDLMMNSDQIGVFKNLTFVSPDKLFDFASELVQAEKDVEKLDTALLFESLWVRYARNK
ncbi:MAG: ATP-binding protein [Pseudobdellovibrio sp.]